MGGKAWPKSEVSGFYLFSIFPHTQNTFHTSQTEKKLSAPPSQLTQEKKVLSIFRIVLFHAHTFKSKKIFALALSQGDW